MDSSVVVGVMLMNYSQKQSQTLSGLVQYTFTFHSQHNPMWISGSPWHPLFNKCSSVILGTFDPNHKNEEEEGTGRERMIARGVTQGWNGIYSFSA